MLHEPVASSGQDLAASFKMRLGVWMFAFYSLLYAAFVAVNLWKPQAMEARILLGMNVATVYGFALIIVALIQALLYSALCSARERRLAGQVQVKPPEVK